MALLKFELSDKQFREGKTLLTEIRDELRNINTTLKAGQTGTTEGFKKVAEAISALMTPEPPPDDKIAVEGKIMARYRLNEDEVSRNPGPKTYTIEATGFKSRAGTPVGAHDIDLSLNLQGSNMDASLANQRLSEDGNSVLADVTIEGHAQQATAELAVLKVSATNRDTGAEVAADTDEFETGPGEAAIGTISTPVPLDEVVEQPAPGGEGNTGTGTGGGETGGGETGSGTPVG